MKRFLKIIAFGLGHIVKWGCVAHILFEHVADVVILSGPSMEPTIVSNDVVIAEKISQKFKMLKKGDIVIAKSPRRPDQFICKRIVAAEGSSDCKSWVPRGHVWLEGDNRSNSIDSRVYGPVPQGLIIGRVAVKVWPLGSAGFFNRQTSSV